MTAALPKISYVLLAHNREQYIRAAIESALAQDYAGELEYIFSDDCSTDRTYDIMKECVDAYTGPRHIILTRTPRNLHLAGHTNHAVALATGEWIVRADDDDYSSIDRCTLIGQAAAQHPDCRYIVTRVQGFTDVEDEATKQNSLQACAIRNTTYRRADVREGYDAHKERIHQKYSYKAWHISVYRDFPLLHQNAYYVDDLSCYYRANLMSYGIYIEGEPAVFMRNGSGNMSRGGDDASRGYASIIRLEKFNDKYFNITYAPLEQELASYRCYLATQTPREQEALAPFIASLEADMHLRELLSTYWRNGTLNRWRIKKQLGYHGLFTYIRCLPLPLFATIQASFRKLKDILN